MTKSRNTLLAAFALCALLAGCDDNKHYDTKGGPVDGWPVWGHTATGQRHSANTQITPGNVKNKSKIRSG